MKRLRVLRRWFARKFGYARLVCLALLIGVAALRIADPAPVEELRVRTFDTFQLVQPRVKTARPVTIVDIDEKSLADPRLGQWPWPRTRIADIVNNLTRMGAVVIAFDVVFAEPDRLNPDMAAENFRGLDEATREKLRALPSNDQIFHTLYDLSERFQVPGAQFFDTGITYEKGPTGKDPHWRGIRDDKGRIMVAICHNMDLGDAWEWSDDPRYPEKWASLAYRIAMNYFVYDLSH